jgi:aspartyl aminopeptidase
MDLPLDADVTADGLIEFLQASPSPFHACAEAARVLAVAGFTAVTETAVFPTEPGRYYLIRGGSLVAWSTEHAAGPDTPLRVVGAHTDSPNLRIKPQPDLTRAGWQLLGVEVYGGPLLNSWLDRDLGLSGRVSVRAGSMGDRPDSAGVEPTDPVGVRTRLLKIDEPLLRVAQLAVHLDRSVNAEGVTLNPQQHLAPIYGLESGSAAPQGFRAMLAERLGVGPEEVLGWDLMTHDTEPARRIGAHGELIASGRLDNLATSYAGTRALIAAADRQPSRPLIRLLVLFDHEEVGSVSERGAYSTLLPAVLERIVTAAGGARENYFRALAGTVIASGDMAHATHPNYAERHEPQHRIAIGGGPVLKINNNLRYATGSPGAAAFVLACEQAGVPVQRFVTRSDLPCGSTVGPMTAALTGALTVDFGAPMLSMHSARELAGVADQAMYVAALTAFLDPH